MYRYKYNDEPEPKEPPESGEDRLIRKCKKIFDIAILFAGILFLVLFIAGIIIRHT